MMRRILVYSDMQSAPWGGSEVLWSRLIEQSGRNTQFGLTCFSSAMTRDICTRHPRMPAYLIPEYCAAHCRSLGKRILGKATHQWSLRVGRKLSLLRQSRFVRLFGPDAIFASLPWPFAGAGLRRILASSDRIPYVCFLHSMAREYMTSPASDELVRFYRQAHQVFTTGRRSAQLLQEWLGTDLDNVLPTHNSVDCSLFRPAKGTRSESPSGPRMISIGRFSHEKGYDILVRALAPMKDVPWTLDMIGDGPLREEIAAMVRRAGLEDKVRFLGQMDAGCVPETLRKYDIFVLPSRIEGMPLSLLEGMASRLACVATDVGSIREVLIHNSSGVLVPPSNEEALRAALKWLIGNRQECVRLGQAARETVVSQCDEGPFVARILKVLQETASLSSRRRAVPAIPASLTLVRDTD